MKQLLRFLICVMPCSQVNAQITVTNATFPALGDTLRMSIDNSPVGIPIDPPGFNYIWDWSQLLQADAHEQTVYRPASEGSVTVPNASLFVQLDNNNEGYYSITSNNFQKLAQYGPVQGTPDLTGLMNFHPPWIERRAPLNFFDISQQAIVVLVEWSAAEVPASFFQQLGIPPDSIRIRIAYNLLEVVNASGTLTIPGGSFEVLREKRILYQDTHMDAKVLPLGWLQITDQAINNAGMTGLGFDTSAQYNFYSNNSKEPIAVLYSDSYPFDDLIVTRAAFKNMIPDIICIPPTNLKVTKRTDSSARLSWNFSDSSVKTTKIMYRAKGAADWIKDKKGNAKTAINLTGLLPNTTYQWKLQSLCEANSNSGWVNGLNFKTLAALSPNNIISIYPNPVTGSVLTVRLMNTNSGSIQLTITDLQGQSFINQKLLPAKGTFSKAIDVSALPKGIYILKIINEKGSQQKIKFVKTN